MESLIYFADINELEAEHMLPFVPDLMRRMVTMIEHPSRPLRQTAITVVGTTAGVVEDGFRPYYAGVLPVLRKAIEVAAGEDQVYLRGKAIECVSMIAVAVGKETFAGDSEAFVGASVRLLEATREGGELADQEGVLR